jgi:hypothetical protein
MGLMLITRERGEEHYGDSLIREPRKCTTLPVWGLDAGGCFVKCLMYIANWRSDRALSPV